MDSMTGGAAAATSEGMSVPGGNGTPSPVTLGANASFPGRWCPNDGASANLAFGAAAVIAGEYSQAQLADCRTSGLTYRLTERQSDRWRSYLVNYTYLMMGCPISTDLVDDGISVFGPANTQAVDGDRPALGRDDMALLIDQYVFAFANELSLSNDDRARLNDYLWTVAEVEIDPEATRGLSRCRDAGIGSGGADVGVDDAGT
jgi:hypothetical protein